MCNNFDNAIQQFRLVDCRVGTPAAYIIRIIGESLAQRLYDASIIHNQAVALALVHTVRTGNRLHQRMRFQQFIQVKATEALDIETGEPHGTNEHNAEFIFGVLEFLIQFPLFHLGAVRSNVQAPLGKCLLLVLFLAYDDRHFRFAHPLDFALQFLGFLLGCNFQLLFESYDFFGPIFLNEIVHADASHLVQANKHRLAASPKV